MNLDATYHVDLIDGTSSQLDIKGWWFNPTTKLKFIGVARFRDGRPCVVFFHQLLDNRWWADANHGLRNHEVTEVPF